MTARFARQTGPVFRAACAALFALACNEDAVEVNQRSLQASSEVTFVCRGQDLKGAEQGTCLEAGATMLGLVTQTATEEVAVVNVSVPGVIDVDPSVPGFSFLRVPSRPGDIVTTPGGAASFVGLTGVGKTGVAGLPTTCLSAPNQRDPNATVRDVTSFPACRLPSRPGDMAVLVEPPGADGIRAGCDAASPLEESLGAPLSADPVATGGCPVDLTAEAGPEGRRKLVVSLPDRGELVVIDAQAVLDHALGTFTDCEIEATVPLRADLDPTAPMQTPPPDLDPGECDITVPVPPPAAPSFLPRPAGFAVGGGRLYVADQGAPVVHVLDASSPCALTELPPLVARSFEEPDRVVTTSRVAVSPLTSSGERFVYAIDEHDLPPSVMAFDVSAGVSDRTPIVRPGSSRVFGEPADRIRFGPPVQDIAFALRDIPRKGSDNFALEGVLCDPDPTLVESCSPEAVESGECQVDPGTLYRSAASYTAGARPRLLRGLFGLAMLSSGQVVVIDVDDFDAPCRRPITANVSDTPDFRGCAGDDATLPFFTRAVDGLGPGESPDGSPTVTNEASCNMVVPHRPRSQSLGIASSTIGVGAPALRSLPRFTPPDSTVQLTPIERPKVLAVDYPSVLEDGTPEPPSVNVGTTLRQKGRTGADLPTDPTTSEELSLVLPLSEPRSYLPGDSFTLTYEGRISGDTDGGFIVPLASDGLPDGATEGGTALFEDVDTFFCDRGVYDQGMMRDYGENELGLEGDALDQFAEDHADYVQVTDGFLPLSDGYWVSERGQDCGGRSACFEAFGRSDVKDLDASRDLTIKKAFQDRLIVTPRLPEALADDAEKCTRCDADPDSPACSNDGVPKDKLTLLWEHCFPGGVRYTVRASKQWVLNSSRPMHDVTARLVPGTESQPLYECVRDCNPKKRLWRSRVFEISAEAACSTEEGVCGLGVAPAGEAVCTYDPAAYEPGDRGVKLDHPASACIFENLVGRFAVYRGPLPSTRGMAFSWQTAGGFVPLVGALTSQSTAVSPQHMVYVPEYQSVAIVDAATLGLSLMSLDTLEVNTNWPVF